MKQLFKGKDTMKKNKRTKKRKIVKQVLGYNEINKKPKERLYVYNAGMK